MLLEEVCKEGGLYRTFSEDSTPRQDCSANLKVHGDPRFDELRYVVSDFTRVRNFDFDVEDIKIMASLNAAAVKSKKRLKIAVVGTNPDIVGWFRLYNEEIGDTGFSSRLFVGMNAARDWCLESL